ncbi:MAG: hypothetical protein WBF06_15535 [Candidatus Acidiferrales bacterium]
MRLSIKSTTIAAALLWGGAILLVGLINLARPTYGTYFLTMIGSVYPLFHSPDKIVTVAIGAFDGLIDGAIAGFLFGWLYNTLLDLSTAQTFPGRHA